MSEGKGGVGIWEICKSTLMSFFGVQKESVRRRDFETGRPLQFIIAGIVFTLLLIAILYGVVKLVLHSAGV
jgi:hypothetical protein